MVGDEAQDYIEVNFNSHNAQRRYLRLTDGIYLNEVMRIMYDHCTVRLMQIKSNTTSVFSTNWYSFVFHSDPNPNVEQIYYNVGDDKILRVQNFSILNRHLRSYYQVPDLTKLY